MYLNDEPLDILLDEQERRHREASMALCNEITRIFARAATTRTLQAYQAGLAAVAEEDE